MPDHEITETLDVKGENCPMPVVKTEQTIDRLGEDDVLEVRFRQRRGDRG